jgi:hypothetical protein
MKTFLITFFCGIVAKTFFGYDDFNFLGFDELKLNITQEDIDQDLLKTE